MRGFPKSENPRIVSDLPASETKRHIFYENRVVPHMAKQTARAVEGSR